MADAIFVSYSRNNADVVDTLVSDAESLGFSPWVDQKLTGGQQWWDEVLRAIRECDVFLYALSPESLDSEACQSEYRYAEALHKPILPVLVSERISDSLVPKELSELQRVDYSGLDKAALSALARGLNSMPPAGPLPDPLPAEPVLPATYLFDLKAEIDKREPMSAEEQGQILDQLDERLVDGHDPEAVAQLLDHLEGRDDLLVKTADGIKAMKGKLGVDVKEPTAQEPAFDRPTTQREPSSWEQTPPPTSQPEQARPPEPSPPPPQPIPTSAPAAEPTGSIHGAWWIAPILFGVIGGVVAWLVNKDTDEKIARYMLFTGIGITVLYFLLASGG